MAKTLIQNIGEFARRRWLMLSVVGIVVVVVLLLINSAGAGQSGALANLQTATLERGNLTATIGATGSVRAAQSATLAWGTSGTVEEVNVSVGDRVAADELLASLELSSLPRT